MTLRDRFERRSPIPSAGIAGPDRANPREADEERGVVFGRTRGRGPGVGEVILAEVKLTPQPPEQGLIKEDESRQAREVPHPGVAPLDVRPLVRQDVPKGPGSLPSQSVDGSRITGRTQA